jgi:hypothetical protein
MLSGTNADFERACLVHIERLQHGLGLYDSAMMATFCEAVRMVREYTDAMQVKTAPERTTSAAAWCRVVRLVNEPEPPEVKAELDAKEAQQPAPSAPVPPESDMDIIAEQAAVIDARRGIFHADNPPKEAPLCEECVECGGMCSNPACDIKSDLCTSQARLYDHCVFERTIDGNCGPTARLFKRRGTK